MGSNRGEMATGTVSWSGGRYSLPLIALLSLLLFAASQTQILPPLVSVLLIGASLALLLTSLIYRWRTRVRPPLPRELELMLDVVSEPCLVTALDGRILSVNGAAGKLFGYEPYELRGQSVDRLVPPRLHEFHRKARGDFLHQPGRLYIGVGREANALRRDGSEFPVQLVIHPVESRGERFIAVSVQDISERKESERIRKQFSAIIENTTDFVAMADAHAHLYYINAAGQKLLGLDGALSPNFSNYLSACDFERLQREALPQARDNGIWTGEVELLHKRGHTIPVWLVVLAHRYPDGTLDFYSTVARDMTERRRDDKRLLRLNRTHAVLTRCNQILVRTEDERELMRDFCTALVETGGYRFAWYGAAQNDPECTVLPIAHAGYEDGYLDITHISWCEEDQWGQGPTGRAIRTGEIVVGRDAEHDPNYAPWRPEARKRGYRSSIALPVGDGKLHLRGCLGIYSSEVDAFDTEEITLLAGLANDLAFGIQTLRERSARAAAESLSRLRNHVIEATSDGIIITEAKDPSFPIVYVNPAFERITGYTREEALGLTPSTLLKSVDNRSALIDIRAALRQGREVRTQLHSVRKDGSRFWNDLTVLPVRNEKGQITHFAGIVNDITESKLHEQQLEYQANHDQLTGLPSRNLMADRLEQLITAGQRHHRPLAVLFLDLDQFKFINDSLGHRIGDQLLKVMADRLSVCIRDGDTLCRYGGDEFVLLLPDISLAEEVSVIAARILQEVAQPMEIDGRQLLATISIGAALFPRDGHDAETLLKNADAAMYRAKGTGRNNIQFYTAELNQRAMERLTIEAELRRAIENNELVLHYQPRVDLRTGRIVGCEALVRWQHPERGLIPPGKFIPIAEETGLITQLGEWVFVEACKQNRAWQDMDLPPITVAVNVSARQLSLPDLDRRIQSVLRTTNLDPGDLELELTESAIMEDAAAMVEKLHQLKSTGAQLSIDDFGTGYSSLSYLSSFPFDALKIDQSFTRNITTSPHDAEIALAIIALATSLRLRVIAEGVETEGQLRYLQRHGCDEFQGYHFSRPVPPQEFAELLRQEKMLPISEELHSELPTVLLVDDEPNVLESLRRVLRREPYRILTAINARDGFEILARTQVDVIVSDERMPDITGVEFLSRVKDLYPETVRVVLSAHADQATVIEAFNRGDIYRFIRKPWINNELRREIHEAVLHGQAGWRV